MGLLLSAVALTATLLALSLRGRPTPNPFEHLLSATPDGAFHSNSAQSLEHLERVARAFFEAPDVEALLAVCRDRERVAPLMARHHDRHPLQPLVWQGLDWARPLREPGQNLFLIQSSFADREPLQLVVELSARGFHADWESHVRYGEMDWPDFLAHRPDTPTLFRVLATLRSEPTDSADGQARLELQHPDHPTPLQGVLSGEDAHWQALRRQLAQRGWKKVPLTLRLCYDEEIQDPGTVRITAVEGRGWLILMQ
jgi:hypothetical protein